MGKLESIEKFRTDLQIVFGMLQYRSNTKNLIGYVNENEDFFRRMDKDTFRAIREFLHSENKLKKILAKVENKGEEKVDMCKALDDLYKMGEEKGYERGEENKLADQIRKKLEKGKDIATIAYEVEETEDVVKQLVEKHNL